jgi:hypothetical protein
MTLAEITKGQVTVRLPARIEARPPIRPFSDARVKPAFHRLTDCAYVFCPDRMVWRRPLLLLPSAIAPSPGDVKKTTG